MTQVVLSHLLPVVALVSRYLTNKLIGRGLILGRNYTFGPETLSGITCSFPQLSRTWGYVTEAFLPRSPLSSVRRLILARLACLIHAANVHSEPGSNPSMYLHIHATRSPGYPVQKIARLTSH